MDILSDWQVLSYCKINKSDFEIEFPNGSQLLFKGLDSSEKIKSITGVTDAWLEELTEFLEDDFDQLVLRLRTKGAETQFFLSFNPTSKASWVFKRWFGPESKVDENITMILRTTWRDNRFLPEDYIKSLEDMAKSNPVFYKIYNLGEWCSLDKLVFNNWKVEEFDYKEIKGTKLFGLDFGYAADNNAFMCSIATEDKKLYIYREWCDIEKTNDEIAKIIKSMGFGKELIICDSAEPKSCEELRRLGLRVKESIKGPDSVNAGIKLIQEYQVIIHPSCTNSIEEFGAYSWQKDKKTGEYIEKPIDMFNHCIDSLRYSLQLLGKGKIRTLDKSKLGL